MKRNTFSLLSLICLLFISSISIIILPTSELSIQNSAKYDDSIDRTLKTSSWNNVTVISDDWTKWNNDESNDPKIAIDSKGNLHVVWEDKTDGAWGSDTEVMYANYTSANGWSNAIVISDDWTNWNNGNSGEPSIAIDSQDNIHVVWSDQTDGIWKQGSNDWEIMYANYTSDDGWSNATVISDGYKGYYWNDDFSFNSDITTDNQDNVHVVWTDATVGEWGSGSDYEVMYVNHIAEVGWVNATVISDGFEGFYWNDGECDLAKIAVDSKGNLHVVWMDRSNGIWKQGSNDWEIMYVKYIPYVGWTNVTVISDGYEGFYWNDDQSWEPDIAIDNQDTIHVVWRDDTAGPWKANADDSEIMYVNYTTVSSWSNTTVISDGFEGFYWNSNTSRTPRIFTDINNNIHVVWEDRTNGIWKQSWDDSEIMYNQYNPENGWSNATVISDGYKGSYWNNDFSKAPDIVIDQKFNVHVVWRDYTKGVWGSDKEIMYTKFTKPIVTPPPSDGDDDDDNGKKKEEPAIPYGYHYLLFVLIGVIGIIAYTKRKIILK